MKQRLSWLALCALVTGCAPRTAPTPGPAAAPRAPNDEARARVWALADTLKLNRPQLIARYGTPVRISADTVTNFNFDRLDSIVRIRFRTFEATYEVHPDHRVELRDVTVSVPAGGPLTEVGPGATREQLVRYLGAPNGDEDFEQGRLLLYEMPRDPSHEIGNVMNVYLVHDRVRWISWIFFPQPSWPAR